MDRRTFITTTGAATATLALPDLALGAAARTPVLVLVELAGGNDGLNCVVPYADPMYHQLRPGLAIARDQVAQLDPRLGLHPELKPLMAAWSKKELGIALGVGYARPNRSHFRSIDIWETASDAGQFLEDGWLARLFARHRRAAGLVADAVVLGGGTRLVTGRGVRAIVMRDPDQFVRQARGVRGQDRATRNPALKHILKVQGEVEAAARELVLIRHRAPALGVEFPKGRFGKRLETAAKMVAAGLNAPVIKLAQNGFDTHSNQPGRHRVLMKQLGTGLAAFRQAMINTGNWDRVMVMTYSEFGRRARQNASRGTDHGTAAPHFLLGGRVRGGLYGRQPSLTDLDGGDLKFTVDYRRLYATAAQGWLGLANTRTVLGPHAPLPAVRA